MKRVFFASNWPQQNWSYFLRFKLVIRQYWFSFNCLNKRASNFTFIPLRKKVFGKIKCFVSFQIPVTFFLFSLFFIIADNLFCFLSCSCNWSTHFFLQGRFTNLLISFQPQRPQLIFISRWRRYATDNLLLKLGRRPNMPRIVTLLSSAFNLTFVLSDLKKVQRWRLI